MTRKDYVLIARAFAEARGDMQDYPERVAGNAQTCRRLASYLKKDNPRFDKVRFVEACEAEV
jgi:hypothetical protein